MGTQSNPEVDVAQKQAAATVPSPLPLWLGGIAFTFLIALLGYGLSLVPVFDRVGPLACSIFIAVAYRQIFGYPEALRPGIQFSAKQLLRLAIILYGLKLNVDVIFAQGLGLLLYDVGVILFSILATLLIAKALKADFKLSLLLGIGTGVCGAAAIAAVSPIVRAKDDETAISVGIIALVGTIFAVMYTILMPFLPVSPVDYGIWSGMTLHELAHVALAAAPAGEDALAMALLAKLGRVLLLVPLCLVLVYLMKRKGSADGDAKISFPYFLLGFLGMSLFGSYVLGTYIPVSESFLTSTATATTFILAMAMVGLGLNINLRDLRKASRPLIAMSITSVLLSFVSLLLI
ncbi:YeiH family protein [Brevibacillus panacihumi]|uniref:Putative sulfate exporter family transporter n=1 Tax=Brevibacillus panacihumi TaxID=497735 RepID=A0A3M8CB50_9BACL|nr:putative sulfate exporter family transporter [Brevibacillus panacihumi]RNB72751.1 putative sulfate exporter family transporter [Brevibacillus panacihumi]